MTWTKTEKQGTNYPQKYEAQIAYLCENFTISNVLIKLIKKWFCRKKAHGQLSEQWGNDVLEEQMYLL